MTSSRTAIQDFSQSNLIYAAAIVTAYTVDGNGDKTNIKASLYSVISGSGDLSNPQTLDSYGKFRQPVYIEDAVILTVTGLGNTPDHDTGVIRAGTIISGTGSPEGVVIAPVGSLYTRVDGGAGTTFYVKESGVSSTGWSAK